MKKLLSFLLVAILWLVISPGCKKSQQVPDRRLNVTLYDKSPQIIESYLQGKWRVHYIDGGICGSCKTDRESFNEYYEFLPGNMIRWTQQNNVLYYSAYSWDNFLSGYTHHIIDYSPYSFEAERIKNDTLLLARPMRESPDYNIYFLTKTE